MVGSADFLLNAFERSVQGEPILGAAWMVGAILVALGGIRIEKYYFLQRRIK